MHPKGGAHVPCVKLLTQREKIMSFHLNSLTYSVRLFTLPPGGGVNSALLFPGQIPILGAFVVQLHPVCRLKL